MWSHQAEMALKQMKQFQSVSPPLFQQVMPLLEQLPPLYEDLANGKDQFMPAPEETDRLVSLFNLWLSQDNSLFLSLSKYCNMSLPCLIHFSFCASKDQDILRSQAKSTHQISKRLNWWNASPGTNLGSKVSCELFPWPVSANIAWWPCNPLSAGKHISPHIIFHHKHFKVHYLCRFSGFMRREQRNAVLVGM